MSNPKQANENPQALRLRLPFVELLRWQKVGGVADGAILATSGGRKADGSAYTGKPIN